jgi:hypothetical protein
MGKNKFTNSSDLVTEVKQKWSPAKLNKRREQVQKMIENHKSKISKRQFAILRLEKEIANLVQLENEQLDKRF